MRRLLLLSVVCAAVAFSTRSASASTIWVNESDQASEADYVVLQSPASFTVDAGDPTPDIYGQIFETGMTAGAGANASISAYVGYGAVGSNPLTDTSWLWFAATWSAPAGNNDEYKAQFTAPSFNGTYAYTYRFSVDGVNFTAADLDGAGSNSGLTFDSSKLGLMTVVNGQDVPVPDRSDSFVLLLMALATIAFQRRRLLSSR